MASDAPRSNTITSLPSLLPLLTRHPSDRPVVLMTCGMAGAGKTTLTRSLLSLLPHFTRLSIDELIFAHHGLYGVDYPASPTLYDSFLDEADTTYLSQLKQLLAARRDVVAEKSFWSRAERDAYKQLIEEHGGRWVLVHLPVDKEVLWDRICERSKRRDANSALEITRAVFEGYWNGFEHPSGEGEVVFKQEDGPSQQMGQG